MKRPSKASGKAGKAGRRKAAIPKHAIRPKAVPSRPSATTTGQETEIARLTLERDDALERQKATAEVLRVISASPGDLKPVFDTILRHATRVCEAKFGNIYLWDGKDLRIVGAHNTPPALIAARTNSPPNPPAGTPLGEMVATKRTVHGDLGATRAYAERHQSVVQAVELGGVRAEVAVPMLKDGELVGAIVIYRQEVRPFSDKQIELVTNFAAQAVIAIENARLLNELRELLENQTASTDILRAIASSPESAERTLDLIAETTARRFGADNVNIRLLEGHMLRYVGSTGPMAARIQELFPEGPLDPNLVSGKAILERRQIYLRANDPALASGLMSNVATPLIREGQAIGAFMVTRSDPRPFSERDLAQSLQLRCPSRHRHREHAAAQRAAAAHDRPYRVPGAADGDIGGPQGHQLIAWRFTAGVPVHAGECGAYLPSQFWRTISSRRRRNSAPCYGGSVISQFRSGAAEHVVQCA